MFCPARSFVMATQNPAGPGRALTRCLIRNSIVFCSAFSLGYPDPAAERELLTTEDRARVLDRTTAMLSPEDVEALQGTAKKSTSVKICWITSRRCCRKPG